MLLFILFHIANNLISTHNNVTITATIIIIIVTVTVTKTITITTKVTKQLKCVIVTFDNYFFIGSMLVSILVDTSVATIWFTASFLSTNGHSITKFIQVNESTASVNIVRSTVAGTANENTFLYYDGHSEGMAVGFVVVGCWVFVCWFVGLWRIFSKFFFKGFVSFSRSTVAFYNQIVYASTPNQVQISNVDYSILTNGIT